MYYFDLGICSQWPLGALLSYHPGLCSLYYETDALPTVLDTKFSEDSEGSGRKASQDFPGGPGVKSLPANAGNTSSIPGLGGSHMPQSN